MVDPVSKKSFNRNYSLYAVHSSITPKYFAVFQERWKTGWQCTFLVIADSRQSPDVTLTHYRLKNQRRQVFCLFTREYTC